MRSEYEYSLSLTSQFPFCSVPLRLDSYSKCQFACRYCFAAARGGSRSASTLKIASTDRIARLLSAAATGRGGVLGEMLRQHIPIHFGGMSDPFPPMENVGGVSLELLRILANNRYPTIISAKGVPDNVNKYIEVIASGRMLVQFSFSVVDSSIQDKVDAGVPDVDRRFEFMAELARAGVPVSVRLQPVFPGHEAFAWPLISRSSESGAKHVAIEYLKYPVESNWRGITKLISSGKGALWDLYRGNGASLIGREWVLPVAYRAERARQLREKVRSVGMTFAYADNDMLHFSDGDTCCTGADLHLGVSGLSFNYHRAIRRAGEDGLVTFSSIGEEWRPSGSVARYLNSRSRARGKTLSDQIRNGWNDSVYAPDSFFGVQHAGRWDEFGYKIYELDVGLRRQYSGKDCEPVKQA